MATLTTAHANWGTTETKQNVTNIWSKWMAIADGQTKNKTFWFLFALVFQGVFFLPIPAVLAFYYNAPLYTLAITLTFFFANVIAGMGGSGIRTLITLFALSTIVHIAMLAIYIF